MSLETIASIVASTPEYAETYETITSIWFWILICACWIFSHVLRGRDIVNGTKSILGLVGSTLLYMTVAYSALALIYIAIYSSALEMAA